MVGRCFTPDNKIKNNLYSSTDLEQVLLTLVKNVARGYTQEPITRSAHLHYPWSNLCPDWAIFRRVSCELLSGTAVRIWPNSTLKRMVTKAKSRILNHFCPFLRWFRPYADSSRDRRSRETILKIAQSGHRLSLRLTMGDGRSGWWAPGTHHSIIKWNSNPNVILPLGIGKLRAWLCFLDKNWQKLCVMWLPSTCRHSFDV